MTQLRGGIVGLGRLAEHIHVPTLSSMDGIDLVAACDVDEKPLGIIASKFQIPETNVDHRALIEKSDLDAVFVLASPSAIAAVAIDVLDAGLAAFLEKPPGLRAGETRGLITATERSGAIAMVGFNRRFQPLIQRVKKQIDEAGPLASLLLEFHPFNFEHYRQHAYSDESLRPFHAAQSIHAVDLSCYLGGTVTGVHGQVGYHFSPYGDTFGALLEFAHGATGYDLCTYTSPARTERAELPGKGVLVRLEGPDQLHERGACPYESAKIYQSGLVAEFSHSGTSDSYNGGYCQEVEYFIDCIRPGRLPQRPVASLPDALSTMEVREAILRNWKGPLNSEGGA